MCRRSACAAGRDAVRPVPARRPCRGPSAAAGRAGALPTLFPGLRRCQGALGVNMSRCATYGCAPCTQSLSFHLENCPPSNLRDGHGRAIADVLRPCQRFPSLTNPGPAVALRLLYPNLALSTPLWATLAPQTAAICLRTNYGLLVVCTRARFLLTAANLVANRGQLERRLSFPTLSLGPRGAFLSMPCLY